MRSKLNKGITIPKYTLVNKDKYCNDLLKDLQNSGALVWSFWFGGFLNFQQSQDQWNAPLVLSYYVRQIKMVTTVNGCQCKVIQKLFYLFFI